MNIHRANDRPVTVAVMAGETAAADLRAYLRRAPGVRLLPSGCAATAEVLLVLAREVGPALVGELRAVTSAAGRSRQRVVLIAETLHESHMPELIGCGVVSILPRREVTTEHLVRVLVESRDGAAVLPNAITRWLVDHARLHQARMLVRDGRPPVMFSAREIDVLCLLAEGHDTMEIAERLNYSARTIKKIIQSILTRFDLRNRVHAVSFAIRAGAI